jgi:hypothetical protein
MSDMARKITMAAADLFVLLDREFRRRKPRECATCFVQLPYRVDAAPGQPNWEVIAPPRCARGCSELFDELLHEFQEMYELKLVSSDERA